MSWLPPGYIHVTALVREHGVDKVLSDVFTGRLQAFQWDGTAGQMLAIEPKFCLAHGAARLLTKGWIPHRSDDCPPCMIIVRVEDQPKPRPVNDGVYRSPFVSLMDEAIRLFDISEQRWPKKEDLEKHFCAQKLPNGTPVSPTQARYLATFCRPLAALRGGNT